MPFDVDAFKSTQVYQTQSPADAIAADIAVIRQIDKETEATLLQYLFVMIASGVVLVGSIVGAIVLSSMALIFVPLAALALLGLIFGAIMRWRLGSLNFEDRRYELVDRLVQMLGRDMPKGANFDLTLDLRTPECDAKYVGEGQQGRWSVKHYLDPWLKLRGRLLDGTSFTLTAIEKFQARGKWGGRRGNKWKTKNRSSTDMLLFLKPKAEKHALLGTLTNDMFGALRLPPWTFLRMLQPEDGGLSLRVGAKCEWQVPPANAQEDARVGFSGVDMVAAMFLSLYQVINLARALQKAQKE